MEKEENKPKDKKLEKNFKLAIFLLLTVVCMMYVNNTFKHYIGHESLHHLAGYGNLVVLNDNFERKFLENFVKIYPTDYIPDITGFLPSVETKDKDSIIDSLKQSSVGVVLPTYIPKGYMLTDSYINYYINENTIQNLNKPSQTGKTDAMQNFEVYPLNDTYKNNIREVLCYKGSLKELPK